MKKELMQSILDDAGFQHVKVIDEDKLLTTVDDEPQVFVRTDQYGGHPLSGLANYGNVIGAHGMIRAIYDDMQTCFELIKTKN